MNPNIYSKVTLYLRKNIVSYKTDIWTPSIDWIFYDIGKVIKQPWIKRPSPSKLLNYEVLIDTD